MYFKLKIQNHEAKRIFFFFKKINHTLDYY